MLSWELDDTESCYSHVSEARPLTGLSPFSRGPSSATGWASPHGGLSIPRAEGGRTPGHSAHFVLRMSQWPKQGACPSPGSRVEGTLTSTAGEIPEGRLRLNRPCNMNYSSPRKIKFMSVIHVPGAGGAQETRAGTAWSLGSWAVRRQGRGVGGGEK